METSTTTCYHYLGGEYKTLHKDNEYIYSSKSNYSSNSRIISEIDLSICNDDQQRYIREGEQIKIIKAEL